MSSFFFPQPPPSFFSGKTEKNYTVHLETFYDNLAITRIAAKESTSTNIQNLINAFTDLQQVLPDDIINPPDLCQQKLIREKLVVVRSKIEKLNSSDKKLVKLEEALNNTDSIMKTLIEDMKLIPDKAGQSSNIEKLSKEIEVKYPHLGELLKNYNNLALRLNSDNIPNIRQSIEFIVLSMASDASLKLLDEDSLALFSKLNLAFLSHLKNSKLDAIDLLVSLNFVQSKLEDPLLKLDILRQKIPDNPASLKRVKEAYKNLISILRGEEKEGHLTIDSTKVTKAVSLLRSALFSLPFQNQDEAGPSENRLQKYSALFTELNQGLITSLYATGIDTKVFKELTDKIAAMAKQPNLLEQFKSWAVNELLESSMVTSIIDSKLQKWGLKDDAKANSSVICAKLDPASLLTERLFYLAHGKHVGLGSNLESLIDLLIDRFDKKMNEKSSISRHLVQSVVLPSLYGPIKALLKQKLLLLLQEGHFNTILAKTLDDLRKIVEKFATDGPPDNYDPASLDEFAQEKFASIRTSIMDIITTKTAEQDTLALKAITSLLETDIVFNALNKRVERAERNISSRFTGLLKRNKTKAKGQIENAKAKTEAKIEKKAGTKIKGSISSTVDAETNLNELLEIFDEYGEHILWDLMERFLAHAKEAILTTTNSNDPPNVNSSYEHLLKSVLTFIFKGEEGPVKSNIEKVVDKYKTSINVQDIVEELTHKTTNWIKAARKEPTEFIKYKRKNLLSSFEGLREQLKDQPRNFKAKLALGKLVSQEPTSYTKELQLEALNFLKEALSEAKKPKIRLEILITIEQFYREGIGLAKPDPKIADKIAKHIVEFANRKKLADMIPPHFRE